MPPKKKPRAKKGKGLDIQEKLAKLGELHLPSYDENERRFRKSAFLGPGSDLNKRIANLDELDKINDIKKIRTSKIKYITQPVNFIDREASYHDLMYGIADKELDPKKRLKIKHEADLIMANALRTGRQTTKSLINKVMSHIVEKTLRAKRLVGLGQKRKNK